VGGGPRLRIGIEAHVVGRRQTGNERVVTNLVTALLGACDHQLVLYFTHPEAAASWRARGHPRTLVRLIRAAHPLVRIPLVLPLRAARDRLDVLLSHVNRPPVAPCPVVTLVHDVAFARFPHTFSTYERLYMNRTIPASIRRSEAIVTVSAFTRDEIVALYGVPRERIAVASNGVDPVFLDPARRSSPVDPPFFLAIGNLQPRKNLRTLLGAYRSLVQERPDRPERLVIVGQEQFEAGTILREAEDLRRAGRIVFTGYVSDRDLVGLLQRATAFAFPSVYEGFGLPPLEAMAAGAPVVASDIPVMREVAGAAALLVPAMDQRAWADALVAIADDSARQTAMAAAGRAHASRFTWDAAARAALEVLERVAHSRRRPRA
jgi:glycosyltransferase involved in cell wall biosynthesis